VQGLVDAIAGDGGLIRVDAALVAHAVAIAEREGLSVYDASYVAGASSVGARLVSCDLRDLVNRGLAVAAAGRSSTVMRLMRRTDGGQGSTQYWSLTPEAA